MMLAALALGAGLFATGAANAGPAWEFTSPGTNFTNGTWDFAQAFSVNSAVTVTGLGYYADPVTGNADGNPVALYQCADALCSTTGTLLTSTNVTNIYPLTGHFRYVTIAPIDLIAGMSYEIVGISNSDNYTWADAGFATDPSITLISMNGGTDRWLSTGSLTFLNGSNSTSNLGGEDGYWGPNLFFGTPTFTQVPEPFTITMFGAGLAAAAGLRLRRSKKN
jgi:hypothetical protein